MSVYDGCTVTICDERGKPEVTCKWSFSIYVWAYGRYAMGMPCNGFTVIDGYDRDKVSDLHVWLDEHGFKNLPR